VNNSNFANLKMSNVLNHFALIFIAIQLFILNYKLLVYLNPAINPLVNAFDFNSNLIDKIIEAIRSISYSLITVLILKVAFDKGVSIMFAWFGAIEGAAYILLNSGFNKFQAIGGVLYAIYTVSLFWAIGFFQIYKKEEKNPDDDRLTFGR
jgi:hypothetical protein